MPLAAPQPNGPRDRSHARVPRRLAVVGLALLGLSAPLASAQEAPAPPPPELLPLGDRYVWELRGTLGTRHAVTGVSVQEGGEGIWLAITREGTIWRTTDHGASWERVQSGFTLVEDEGLDDEELLLEAEAARDEALRDAEDGEGEDAQDVDPTDPDAVRDAALEADQAARDAALDAEQAAEAAAEEAALRVDVDRNGDEGFLAPTVWFHPSDPGLALASWPDTTMRSIDGGQTWAPVDLAGATTFFAGTDPRLVVAGTVDGIRYSLDGGEAWIDVVDDTDGARIRQVAQEGAWLYAASDHGVFRSENGLHWAALPGLGGTAAVSVVPDPAWEGGLWVATSNALLRSDDDGRTFYLAGRHPLRGLRRVVALAEQGHLLAITSDGVWESVDGGVRWLPAIRLLREPDVWDVAFDAGLPVVATRAGVWRMVTPVSLDHTPGKRVVTMSLGDAVTRAEHRGGLDLDPLTLATVPLGTWLLPTFQVSWVYNLGDGRDTAFFEESTSEYVDQRWGLYAVACWGGCNTTVVIDADSDTIVEGTSESDLYVLDGQVYDSDGDVVASAANVAERMRRYRHTVASTVADAWLARVRLEAEAPLTRNMPLRAQVMYALDMAEMDARLDIYTDGAFGRSLTTTEEPR